MSKSVFYSFHFDRDFWRVQNVRNIGSLDATEPVTPQKWETVKGGGDPAIEKWIAEQMAGKAAVVVLVGAETASRKWVKREIAYAWDHDIPLVGVRINGLRDSDQKTDPAGANPFAEVGLQRGGTVADHVSLHKPGGSDSKQVHASITANMESWVNGAYRRT